MGILGKSDEQNAEPLDVARAYTTNDLITTTVVGGPFTTGGASPSTLNAGYIPVLRPLAPIAANTLSDPMVAADYLLFEEASSSIQNEFDIVEQQWTLTNQPGNAWHDIGDLGLQILYNTSDIQFNLRNNSGKTVSFTNAAMWYSQAPANRGLRSGGDFIVNNGLSFTIWQDSSLSLADGESEYLRWRDGETGREFLLETTRSGSNATAVLKEFKIAPKASSTVTTLYNQANTGGIGTSVGTVADIGFALQPGDHIMLQTDLGVADAIWTGAASVQASRVDAGGITNTIIFSQAGTVLQMQGGSVNGTRQWLKIDRTGT